MKQTKRPKMKYKKAGLWGKILIFLVTMFIFLIVAIKYPGEGKIIISKLYQLLVVMLDFLIELIGQAIKWIAN